MHSRMKTHRPGVAGVALFAVMALATVAQAKVTGTHSGGKCTVTDSAGVTAVVNCGGGISQATCNADGSCSVGALARPAGGVTGVKAATPVDECVAYPERCPRKAKPKDQSQQN